MKIWIGPSVLEKSSVLFIFGETPKEEAFSVQRLSKLDTYDRVNYQAMSKQEF